MAIEPDFLFPLLRGADIKRWKSSPVYQVLIPHDPEDPAKGFPVTEMQAKAPKTYSYLKRFEEILRGRSGFKLYFDTDRAPFYSVYNVGSYTFADHKVCWREVANELIVAVSSPIGEKVPVPDHTLVTVECASADEAHYLCALLNSSPSNFIVRGYVALHPSPHILKYIRIGKFDPKENLHRSLAANSKALHEATAAANTDALAALEAENLKLAAEYWGLEKSEVADIKASLEELS